MNDAKPLDVFEVERIEGCGIVVLFSDGTRASYSTEELAYLRPHRDPIGLELSN